MIRFVSNHRRPTAIFFVFLQLFQFIGNPVTYALTSGPTQPEVQGFQPAGTTEMVDLFSGDFGYNIPLFELPGPNGGYPFNLAYQSGIGMEQESSWVGLGWTLNPGAINRQMRGLPDEFKGDQVSTKMSISPSVTVGLSLGTDMEFFGGALKLGQGFSLYKNSFRGIGYSIDYSAGFGTTVAPGITAGIGVDVSLDSQEGVGVSPSLSLGVPIGTIGLGMAYNSKQGLSSLTYSYDTPRDLVLMFKNTTGKDKGKFKAETRIDLKSSATLSYATASYTPQISMPMQNMNLSATFKAGGAWVGVYGEGYVTGFYNEQKLKNDKRWVTSKAFGYLNYQENSGDGNLLDFNREKDGMVSRITPNLGIPSLTYDVYSVVGQGISAMYRPIRNDIGIVQDQRVESESTGGSGGVDVSVPPSHFGVSLSLNHSRSRSGAWTDNNEMDNRIGFQKQQKNNDYEPWYFKAHGEQSINKFSAFESLGGDKAVRVRLTDSLANPTATKKIERADGWKKEIPDASANRERKSRNQVILPITNEQLLKSNEEVISLFKVKWDSAGQEKVFKRTGPSHHTAGYTALTPEGLRYNYAIPAYNLSQEEISFSAKKKTGDVTRVSVKNCPSGDNNCRNEGDPSYEHSGTDKFLKRTKLPGYAHAYLLTSIVGPDYVDLTGDGVSADDLGYWVKFTYKKTTSENSPYMWREPFSQAHFQEGWKTDPRDDRGSFSYGTKELWYLVKAETKSHIAEFSLDARQDGRGAAAKFQDTNSLGASVQALKSIKLYSRSAGKINPIKVVKFEYDYSLCKNVFNNDSGEGKLTLKKLWFEYGSSTRGQLNPYVFDYHENNAAENPDYDMYAYDRWGNYKPYPENDRLHNIDYPYAEQKESEEETIHNHAAVWSLKEIKLPSGGKVVIDYESDDYAYVQHQQAMQMTDIVSPEGSVSAGSYTLTDNNLKIKFKLAETIPVELTQAEQRAEVMRYLDQSRKQLYFKIKINIRKPQEDFFEFISGYADIDFEKINGMLLEKEGGVYTHGYFYLKPERGRHPFSLRAWQHVRTNQPELANNSKPLEPTASTGKRIEQMKSLGGNLGDHIKQMFKGFNEFCDQKHWGREIDVTNSWIRLNSIDFKKMGGGLRVRQITMTDQWQGDAEGVYGQVYNYTTEENGQTISSGVAAYEPMVGGDENALRYAKKYTESVPLRAQNNLFFEYPVNESYYPGPQVGYRKVTVTSLAAASLAGKDVKNIQTPDGPVFPTGENVSFGTSGQTVHEFYTAKEFPVIADETEKKDKPYEMSRMLPLLGTISASLLTSSQGYSVVTNDMHGKPYRVSNFRQTKTGEIEKEPISWVKYNYAVDSIFYQGKKVSVLKNIFKDNNDGTLSLASKTELSNASVPKVTVGQETEIFLDMRQTDDIASGGKAYWNSDLVYFVLGVIPIPTSWPNLNSSVRQLRTSVVNKVIFKSSILVSTEAYDGGSRVLTENVKWDKETGGVILTMVNNNFNKPIYNYSILAYKEYEGMGGAYQNIGLKFSLSDVGNLPYHDNHYEFKTDESNFLAPGDELVLYRSGSGFRNPVAKVTFIGEENDEMLLFSPTSLTDNDYDAMVVRSGFRNQLSVSAGTITALKDPTVPGIIKTYEKTILVPREN